MILAALVNCLPYLVEKGLELYVEDTVYDELIQMTNPENEDNKDKDLIDGDRTIVPGRLAKSTKLHVFNRNSPRKQGVDLVIAFGGDGLLMHCNTLFGGGSIPPSMCFDFGSLGFLAPFDYKDFELEVSCIAVCCLSLLRLQDSRHRYFTIPLSSLFPFVPVEQLLIYLALTRRQVDRVLIGPVFLTLRMRLHGRIIRIEEEIGTYLLLPSSILLSTTTVLIDE